MSGNRRQPSRERKPELNVVLGTNGTGKTEFIEMLLRKRWESARERSIVVDYDGYTNQWRKYDFIDVADKKKVETCKGIRKCFYQQHGKWTHYWLRQHFYNGTVVYEDSKAMLPSYLQDEIERILAQRRPLMWDIFIVAHGFEEVPPRMWNYYDNLYLFKTNKNMSSSLRREISNSAAIEEAKIKVDAAYARAKEKNNDSHFGIAVRVSNE